MLGWVVCVFMCVCLLASAIENDKASEAFSQQIRGTQSGGEKAPWRLRENAWMWLWEARMKSALTKCADWWMDKAEQWMQEWMRAEREFNTDKLNERQGEIASWSIPPGCSPQAIYLLLTEQPGVFFLQIFLKCMRRWTISQIPAPVLLIPLLDSHTVTQLKLGI